jgi:hypothetical protein
MVVPEQIKIFHIVHISRLPAILSQQFLFSDTIIQKSQPAGVTIGMSKIKRRRLEELVLSTRQGLHVGECVPFYFCPRPVMLYMLHKGNHPDIEYHGGQEPIIHLVADLKETVEWAESNKLRWAFTNSNAGSYYFDDFSDLADLDRIDWNTVRTQQWSNVRDKKQAEFLIEQRFPWELIEKIGVFSVNQLKEVENMLATAKHSPNIRVERSWYY